MRVYRVLILYSFSIRTIIHTSDIREVRRPRGSAGALSGEDQSDAGELSGEDQSDGLWGRDLRKCAKCMRLIDNRQDKCA